ncbi:MAG: ABC transporter ATP-binding protein [Pseudomonadota bacterium]
MLQLDGLTKSFKARRAVCDLTFGIAKGEVVGFLGQNGAGKSTTMRMIAGVLEPDAGDAVICGASITADRPNAQRQIGYLPEGAPLYQDMAVSDLLGFLADAHGLQKASKRVAIDRVIADARISDVARQTIATLSKGYRRRVGLAGALLHDPPVLLLDEPTDGLDPLQKRAVRALISRMAETKAILISTHTLEEVPAMCSRVVIVDHGRVVGDDTPGAFASQHAGGLEAAFISLTAKEEEARI